MISDEMGHEIERGYWRLLAGYLIETTNWRALAGFGE
jgi:hypothetical protein